MSVVIHIHPTYQHQREHAEWFRAGLRKHGIGLEVTTDPLKDADIHIISGPHYAKKHWLGHPRTILLDRCYYREEQKPPGMVSMPCVSLGWMRKDGGRDFRVTGGRIAPRKKDKPDSSRTIFLADYGGPIERADTVRLHPAQESHERGLKDILREHGTAIGYQTTALVTAGLEGLDVYCKDKRSIMSEPNWLELLPYADWSYREIMNGDAWEHLQQS